MALSSERLSGARMFQLTLSKFCLGVSIKFPLYPNSGTYIGVYSIVIQKGQKIAGKTMLELKTNRARR